MASSATALSLFALPFDLGGNPGASLGAHRIAEVFRRRFATLGEPPTPPRWQPWNGKARIETHPYRLDHTFSAWAAELGVLTVASARGGELPVFVGGNHLSLAPAYDALFGEIPDLHVVSLDAHHDLGGGRTADGGPSHANFWLSVVRPELLERTVWIGPRAAPPASHGDVRWIGAGEWDRLGPGDVVARLELAGRSIVLDIDLDVLDASVFPATVSRTPGGPSWLQAAALITELASLCEVRCVGMAEYNPLLDDPFDTSLAASTDLLLHSLDAVLPERPGAVESPEPLLKPEQAP